MQPAVNATKKPNTPLRWILIGAAALVTVCCACAAFIYFVPPLGSPTATPAPAVQLPASEAPVTTVTPEPTQAPEPTATPAPQGQMRDQPVPMGSLVDIGGDMQLAVLDVTRPANDLVQQFNQFNDEPEAGFEYMMVRLEVKCNKPANETCNFLNYEIKTVGANGQVRDEAFVAGVEDKLETTEFFGGNSIDGHMIFLAAEGDTSTVLFFDPLFFGDPVYLALQ